MFCSIAGAPRMPKAQGSQALQADGSGGEIPGQGSFYIKGRWIENMAKKGYRTVWAVIVPMAAAMVLAGCLGKAYEEIDLAQVQTGQPEAVPMGDIWIYSGEEGPGGIVIQPEGADVDRGQGPEEIRDKPQGQKTQGPALLIGGDVLLSDHVLHAYDAAGGIGGVLDEGYRQAIRDAGFFLVNQEFPFSHRGAAAKDKQYTFRLPPNKVALFQEMGIDGVALANNHALDFGRDALLDTCGVLDAAGILHTGAGADLEQARRPVAIEAQGKKVAVIGATRVMPTADWAAGKGHPGMLAAYDMAVLLDEIRIQRQANDFVAVYIHWGVEKEETPQEYQRAMGRQMVEAGADLVVGAHPHVLQGVEYYQGKLIAYSLGNFVFGSSIPRTALLQVDWEKGQDMPKYRLLPGTSGAGYTRMITDEAGRQEFFRYMESISFNARVEEDGTLCAK